MSAREHTFFCIDMKTFYSSKVTSAQAMEKGLPLPAGFNTNGWNGVVSI